MAKRTIGVLALIGLVLIGGFLFSKIGAPYLEQLGFQKASDAQRIKATITVAGDNYLGYWFVTSPEFTRRLRDKGYALKWVNDQGDYADRHQKFARSEYDMMALPVNSYLQHGMRHHYPGVIPVALSESKGADSVVAYQEKIIGQEQRALTINDLNNANLKICVTPDSPSSFLLNIAVVHFALDELRARNTWRVETQGSQDAFKKFQERRCDAAVLWEPDVSRALAMPGVVTVFGSEQVSEMIIDVFAVRRQLWLDNPDLVLAFFGAYFETLSHYGNNREEMFGQMLKNSGFDSKEALGKAVDRIVWFDGEQNCRDWFGVGLPGVAPVAKREKLVDVITQITSLMVDVKDVAADPLAGRPYLITNSEVLTRLCPQLVAAQAAHIGAQIPVQQVFASLSDAEWTQLRIVGRMRVVPIVFQSGNANLTADGRNKINEVAAALLHNFPQYRILIKGHTAPSGDEEANVALSQERADAVKAHLETVHGVDPNRLKAVGVASREPLTRQRGEGDLQYRNRLARVEYILFEDRRSP